MNAPDSPRPFLEACLEAALARVDGEACVRAALERGTCDSLLSSNLWLLAAGKAACPMARAAEHWAAERLRGGLAITKDGHAEPLGATRVIEGPHPIPDRRTNANAREVVDFVRAIPSGDSLLVLLSGGTSALLSLPVAGIGSASLAHVTERLLAAGADIEELNSLRKHVLRTGGGRLAEAANCREIAVLVLSDVPGDRLDVIASAPFAGDSSSFRDVLRMLERRGLVRDVPRDVLEHLEGGRDGRFPETPLPDSEVFARVRHEIIASNADALESAVSEAGRRGWRAINLGSVLRGEARVAAQRLVALAKCVAPNEPTLLAIGGETSVTVRGQGCGGRNQELALAAAIELEAHPGLTVLAVGSDGTDGPTDAAGAFADSGTLGRAHRLGMNARSSLDDNDSYSFFSREGGALRTGPTRTNVMDLAFVAISPRSS